MTTEEARKWEGWKQWWDLYASAALSGLAQARDSEGMWGAKDIAEDAAEIADALVKIRMERDMEASKLLYMKQEIEKK